jgi:hypothetical protein
MRARRGLLIAAVVAGTVAALRAWHMRWGATPSEVRGALPGDEMIPLADLTTTRAITIRATPAQVWPWLVQIGQGRGGFYSYDMLENLVGCEIHSAERIEPAWQHLAVGDQVRLHPEIGLDVAEVAAGQSLVLRGGVPLDGAPPPYDFTWSFVLRERGDGTTRLLIRERYGYTRQWARLLVETVEVADFVMTQRMLRGIRDRAERVAA